MNAQGTDRDIIERLRSHVNDRGGQFKDDDGIVVIPNGAWAMMLEAADTIERLTAREQVLVKALEECAKDSYLDEYELEYKPTSIALLARAALSDGGANE